MWHSAQMTLTITDKTMLCIKLLNELCWMFLFIFYAECHNADCRFAECRYPECCYAECRYAKCRGTFFTFVSCPLIIFVVNVSKFCLIITQLLAHRNATFVYSHFQCWIDFITSCLCTKGWDTKKFLRCFKRFTSECLSNFKTTFKVVKIFIEIDVLNMKYPKPLCMLIEFKQ